MAIVRPITKTLISSATWGVPITDEVNRLSPLVDGRTPTVWTGVVFQNGWATAGGWQPGQYRKVGDVVQLRGNITGTAPATAFTLPTGFRPPTPSFFPLAGAFPASSVFVQIFNDGTFQVQGSGSMHVGINGITFSITP